MQKYFRSFGFLVAAALLLTTPALADVTITVEGGDGVSTMYLTPDKMAAVSKDGKFVFDAASEAITVDTPQGTQPMTKKQLKDMSQMARGMDMSAMNEQMAEQKKKAIEQIKAQGLPPEQEAQALKMIEKAMPSAPGGGAEKPAKTYKKLGKSQEVAGFKTEGYTVLRGGEPTGEVWVADLKDVGVSKDDMAVMTKLTAFFKEVSEGNPFMEGQMDEFSMFDPNSKDFLGVPLRMVDADGAVTTVTSIEKGKVDASVFGK